MLSLLVPTRNRPGYLRRLLLYLRQMEFHHQIVIADSSSIPICETNLRIAASMRNELDIAYKQYEPEAGFFSKIAGALSTFESKYSVICGDDDFPVERAMDQCVQFMESNPDYSVAHGRLVNMYPLTPVHGTTRLCTQSLSQRTLDDPDPCLRLREHLQGYEATFYSVQRRTDMIRNIELAAKVTKDYRFGELLPSCLSVIQGKVKYLKVLHGVRPYHPDSTSGSHIDWASLLASDDFSDRYTAFRNCLIDELVGVARVATEEAGNIADEAFLKYLARILYEKYRLGIDQRTSRTARRMKLVWQTARALPAAICLAFMERRAGIMIADPRQFVRLARIESDPRYMSVDRMLHTSAFRSDFSPIHEIVMCYPQGVPDS